MGRDPAPAWIRCPGAEHDPARFLRRGLGALTVLVGLASIGLAIPTDGIKRLRTVTGVPTGIYLCLDSLDRVIAVEFKIGNARFRADDRAALSTPQWDPATPERVFHWSRGPFGNAPMARVKANGDRVLWAQFWSADPPMGD
jgi:hypothetical protein